MITFSPWRSCDTGPKCESTALLQEWGFRPVYECDHLPRPNASPFGPPAKTILETNWVWEIWQQGQGRRYRAQKSQNTAPRPLRSSHAEGPFLNLKFAINVDERRVLTFLDSSLRHMLFVVFAVYDEKIWDLGLGLRQNETQSLPISCDCWGTTSLDCYNFRHQPLPRTPRPVFIVSHPCFPSGWSIIDLRHDGLGTAGERDQGGSKDLGWEWWMISVIPNAL